MNKNKYYSRNIMEKSMTIILLVVTAVGADNTQIQGPLLECGDNERIISLNSTLTPPDEIFASNRIPGFTDNMVLNFGTMVDTWCTYAILQIDEYRNITINFSYPVLITAILSSGTIEERSDLMGVQNTFTDYVTNFTLDYWTMVNDTKTYSTELENPKYLASSKLNTFIKFEEPFVAQSIRLKAIDWYSGTSSNERICQGVAIFGCLYSEAVSSEPPTTAKQTTSEYEHTTANTATSGGTVNACICDTNSSTNVAMRQGQSLTTLVLAPVLAIIVLIAILQLIGVVIYVVKKKREMQETTHRRLLSQQSSCTDGGDNTLRCKTEAKELTEESIQGVESECQVNPRNEDFSESLSNSGQSEKQVYNNNHL